MCDEGKKGGAFVFLIFYLNSEMTMKIIENINNIPKLLK